MTWTTQTPTKPGWYWFRTSPQDADPWVVKVQRIGYGMMQVYRVGCETPTIIGTGGEWQGPLNDHDQAQREEIERLTEQFRTACNDCISTENENQALRKALRELRALVNGECPRLLDEDRGGDAGLDVKIKLALKEQ